MGKNNRKYHKRYHDRKDNNMNDKNINSEDKITNPEEMPEDAVILEDVNSTPADNEEAEQEVAEGIDSLAEENEKLKAEVEKEKKEYLFLMAEFDNFRKRTLKEKSELIKNAAESAFKGLLPIVDDFERAIKASENSDEASSIKEGMELIYKKLKKYMEQNGVKEMDPEDREFDADKHEAISAVPVPDEAMKGKILDTVEKGYTINDKVLRHAKVVVGQ
jgi:grpE